MCRSWNQFSFFPKTRVLVSLQGFRNFHVRPWLKRQVRGQMNRSKAYNYSFPFANAHEHREALFKDPINYFSINVPITLREKLKKGTMKVWRIITMMCIYVIEYYWQEYGRGIFIHTRIVAFLPADVKLNNSVHFT